MQYEYVISGPSYVITKRDVLRKYAPEFNAIFEQMNSYFASDSHKVSWLFNGHTEQGLGRLLTSVYPTQTFYVDSGGLQMITLGKTITNELKDEVYRCQAEYGDYAMSFDEIPIKLLSSRSTFHDVANRVVDIDNFDAYAEQSAKNLKAQCQYFINSGTKARPFMIIQGYSFESYQRWTDIILGHLSAEEIAAIGGISCGAAALGQGSFEDYYRAMIIAVINAPEHIKKHIHLLGVGSIKRLVPFVQLINNGTIKCETLSYDSTTASSSMSMCSYQLGPKLLTFSGENPAGFNECVMPTLVHAYREIFNIPENEIPNNIIYDSYCLLNSKFYAKHGLSDSVQLQFQKCKLVNLCSNVINFVNALTLLKNDTSIIGSWWGNEALPGLTFSSVESLDDFNKWANANRSMVRSKKVPIDATNNIGDFFK